MKLSEVLKDWPEYRINEGGVYWNNCKDLCDREIDREALADELMKMSLLDDYEHKVNHLIETMPTWLRKVEGK